MAPFKSIQNPCIENPNLKGAWRSLLNRISIIQDLLALQIYWLSISLPSFSLLWSTGQQSQDNQESKKERPVDQKRKLMEDMRDMNRQAFSMLISGPACWLMNHCLYSLATQKKRHERISREVKDRIQVWKVKSMNHGSVLHGFLILLDSFGDAAMKTWQSKGSWL